MIYAYSTRLEDQMRPTLTHEEVLRDRAMAFGLEGPQQDLKLAAAHQAGADALALLRDYPQAFIDFDGSCLICEAALPFHEAHREDCRFDLVVRS